MLKLVSNLTNIINKQITLLVVSLIFMLSILLSAAVFYRYVLNDSLYWSGEVARYMLVYLVMLGSTVAHKYKSHIRIDIIFSYISIENTKKLEILASISFIVFWSIVLAGSIKVFPLFMMQTTATLEIPFGFAFAAIPIAASIWIFYCTVDILNALSSK